MRPSKNVHLLARLRAELGLSQEDVGNKIGVNERTIRRIELGSQKLTAALAERIGDSYDVDPDCLMKNDLEKGLRTREGGRWTRKIRLEIKNRLQRWGDLEPYARQEQRGLHAVLLDEYLQISHLIRQLPSPSETLFRWSFLFMLAKGALIHAEPETEKLSGKDYFCNDRLETVLDDVQAVLSEIRVIKRVEKRAKSKRQNGDPKLQIKLAYIGRFGGFNECGLIATKLVDELSISELKNMQLSDFDDLVRERCKKEGVPIPKRFDPFKAMQNYLDYFATKRPARM
jgi:transcriptional regulator with XRE-family HTH domain